MIWLLDRMVTTLARVKLILLSVVLSIVRRLGN